MKRIFFISLFMPLLLGLSLTTPNEAGIGAFKEGKFDDALENFQKAVDANPGKAEPHYNLADAYYKKGEYDKALREYDEAVKIDPKMADAHYNSGNSLYRMGEYEKALGAYREAENLNKADPKLSDNTRHNIELTLRKVKEEERKKKQAGGNKKGGRQGGQGQSGGSRKPSGANDPGSQPNAGGQGSGAPGMSNEEVQAMLDRQQREEKDLRNYFKPGKKEDPLSERERQIEQILRSAGLAPQRPNRPDQPQVEKDW